MLVLACLATLFVVYGSLVPFHWRGVDVYWGIYSFANLRYLNLGTGSRADLVANALIYIPVSFFWCCVIAAREKQRFPRSAAIFALLVTLVCLLWLVEFAQVFAKPRTVSQNDIIAETIGVAIGWAIWFWRGENFRSIASRILVDRRLEIRNILLLYVIAYLLLAFFPFDFLISIDEISRVFADAQVSFWGSAASKKGPLIATFFHLAEIAYCMPFGYMLFRLRHDWTLRLYSLVAVSLAVFALIDFLQIFTVSGTHSIVGVFTRTAGVAAGWALASFLQQHGGRFTLQEKSLRLMIVLAFPPFLLLIALIKRWSLPLQISLPESAEILAGTYFTPFYYHYFTTEVHAFTSLLIHLAMLFPLGICNYLLHLAGPRRAATKPSTLFLIGALTAFAIEAAGLLFVQLRPDPTNILLGAFAVYFGYVVSEFLHNSFLSPTAPPISSPQAPDAEPENVQVIAESTNAAAEVPAVTPVATSEKQPADQAVANELAVKRRQLTAMAVCRLIALFTLVACGFYLVRYPLSITLMLIASLLYVLALSRWKSCWLVLLPAALPLADLYVLSGRYFMSELDYLILLTLTQRYFTGQVLLPDVRKDKLFFSLLAVLILAYIASISQFLHAPVQLEASSFYSMFSPFNSLRISKSLFWVLLLFPALAFEVKRNPDWFRPFSQGMIGGLLTASLVVVLERALFTGLFNFSDSGHRAKGSFSSMHAGGGDLDAFMMMTLPFLILALIRSRTTLWRALYTLVLVLAGYTIFVTYSRGPYIVTFVLVLAMVITLLGATRRSVGPVRGAGFLVVGTAAAMAWISIPFLYDTVLSDRIELVERDKNTRVSHWREAIDMVGVNGRSWLFGNGPGSFPYYYSLARGATPERIAIHQLTGDAGNTTLAISSGSSLFTNQYVSLDTRKNHQLHLDASLSEPAANLSLTICEVWITDSHSCFSRSIRMTGSPEWSSHAVPLSAEELTAALGRRESWGQRPLALSLSTARGAADIKIDNIRLVDDTGTNLLRNSDFEHGKDYWFFTADSHLHWHVFNAVVSLYHDYGVAGLVCILSLMSLAMVRLLHMSLSGNQNAVAFMAALLGVAGMGIVTSIFDVPQLTFLLYFLLAGSQLLWMQFRTE